MVVANPNKAARPRRAAFLGAFAKTTLHSLSLSACLILSGLSLANAQTPESQPPENAREEFNGYPVLYAELASLATDSLLLDVVAVGDSFLAVGERGHILKSSDGESWTQVPAVPTRSTITAVEFVGDMGWAVGHEAVILHTTDGGDRWQLQYYDPDLDQALLNVRFFDQDNGFAIGAYGMMLRTSDGGETWEEAYVNDEDDFFLNDITRLADGTLFIAAEAGNSYFSVDGGDTWEWAELPYAGSMFGALALRNSRVMTFGLRGHVFTTHDSGATWDELDTATDSTLLGGSMDADGNILIVGARGVILQLPRASREFTRSVHPDEEDLSAVVRLDDSRIIVVGKNGVDVVPLAQ